LAVLMGTKPLDLDESVPVVDSCDMAISCVHWNTTRSSPMLEYSHNLVALGQFDFDLLYNPWDVLYSSHPRKAWLDTRNHPFHADRGR